MCQSPLQTHRAVRTADPVHSIWSELSEPEFRQHLVDLGARTNSLPLQPQAFSPRDWPKSDRALPLEVEQQIADAFAWLAGVEEGAQSVAAVCVEELCAVRELCEVEEVEEKLEECERLDETDEEREGRPGEPRELEMPQRPGKTFDECERLDEESMRVEGSEASGELSKSTLEFAPDTSQPSKPCGEPSTPFMEPAASKLRVEHVSSESPKLTIRFAALDTSETVDASVGTGVRQALHRISDILVRAASCVERESGESENVRRGEGGKGERRGQSGEPSIEPSIEPGVENYVENLLRIVVHLHSRRILGRLRSSRWEKPKHLARSHKKPLWQDFANLLHRIQFAYAKNEKAARQGVEKRIRGLADAYERFDSASNDRLDSGREVDPTPLDAGLDDSLGVDRLEVDSSKLNTLDVDKLDVDSPKRNLDVESLDVDSPKLSSLDVDSPKLNLDVGPPKNDVDSPKPNVDSPTPYIDLLHLVTSSYAFCTSKDIADFVTRLENGSKPTAQVASAIKCLRQVEKIAAYKQVCLTLTSIATRYNHLFKHGLALQFLTPYHSIPTTIAHHHWVKTCHVHAEVQLAVHYDLLTHTSFHPPRAIGTSKWLCYLCYHFLLAHHTFFPSNTHGRLYDQWTVPDLAEFDHATAERYRRIIRAVDAAVLCHTDSEPDLCRLDPMTSRQHVFGMST